MTIDFEVLRDRLISALPQLTYDLVTLEHSASREQVPALTIETDVRKKDYVYRMAVAVIDDHVNFFVHIHGTSSDLSTKATQRFRKACKDIDEVFAIVHSCWTGGLPS